MTWFVRSQAGAEAPTTASAAGPEAAAGRIDAQAREYRSKVEALVRERLVAKTYLAEQQPTGSERELLAGRIGMLDDQIKLLELELAGSQTLVTPPELSAGTTPATGTPLPPLPGEYVWLGTLGLLALLPLSLAYAKRMWRRDAPSAGMDARALDDRLSVMQTAIESVAIEVERISEGQRFVTQVLRRPASILVPSEPSPRVPAPMETHVSAG